MKFMVSTMIMLSAVIFTSYCRDIMRSPRFLFIAGSGLVIFMVILLFRKISVCLLKSRAVYTPDKILNKNKPFYTNKSTWEHIRLRAYRQQKEFNELVGSVNRLRLSSTFDKNNDY